MTLRGDSNERHHFMTSPRYLTKSRFKLAAECPKSIGAFGNTQCDIMR